MRLQRIVNKIESGADDCDPRILRAVKGPAAIWMEWFNRIAEIMRWDEDGLLGGSLKEIVMARLRKIGLIKGHHVCSLSLCVQLISR